MIRMIWSSHLSIFSAPISLVILHELKSKMSLKFILVIIFGLLSFSSPAFSNTAGIVPEGAYAGVRLGYSYNRNSCLPAAIKCDREDLGYGLIAGYEFGNQFALELSATKLGDTTAVYPDIKLTGELFTVDASLKYTYTLPNQLQVFGKAGLVYWAGKIIGWNEDATDSGVRPAAGFGLILPLSENIDSRLEYQYFDQLGNNWMGYTDANFFSFSLIWKFSSTRKTAATPFKNNSSGHVANYSVAPHGFLLPEAVIDTYVERILSDAVNHEI